MHTPPNDQADITLMGHGIGAHLHLLMCGDTRVGAAQIRRTDAAAGQQCFMGQAFGLEGTQHQGHGIEGGEVGMQHGNFQPGDGWKWSKLHAGQLSSPHRSNSTRRRISSLSSPAPIKALSLPKAASRVMPPPDSTPTLRRRLPAS